MEKLQKKQNEIREKYNYNIEITGFVSGDETNKSYSFSIRNMNKYADTYVDERNYKNYKECLEEAIKYFNKNFKKQLKMEKLTGKEILELLTNISWEDLGYDNVDWENLLFGKVEVTAQYGGEGKGEEYYKVYHFVDHDVYIRIDGFYQSYNGAEFHEAPYEVKPIQKTIIVYS